MASGKRKKGNRHIRKLFFVIILAVMVAAALPQLSSIARLYAQKEELSQRRDTLQQEYDELFATNEAMDDLETIEKLAREKLGMVRDGERLMVEGKDQP